MQGEDDERRAHGIGERVENVGRASRDEDLVQLVHDTGGGDDEPGRDRRIAAEAGPEDRGHAPERHRVQRLVPDEVHEALHHPRLVQQEELDEESDKGEEAGRPEPGRRRKRDAHG